MQEIVYRAKSGYAMFALNVGLVLFALGCFLFSAPDAASYSGEPNVALMLLGVLTMLAVIFVAAGYVIIDPNEAKVLTLFGKYKGTIKDNGFLWANPLCIKRGISLRARNLNSEKIKVNDKNGNPIVISAVIVWGVSDTARALFAVDNYVAFVHTQSEAAIRTLAGRYPYDNFETDKEEGVTLRTDADAVSHALEKELTERLQRAGVTIMEARINHLAYAEEIANAMLQRQQASAVVAARKQIVAGAVGIVEMALKQLAEREFVHLDEERKAAMVSNLLVVLTGDKNVQPVMNTGTLYN